MIDLQILYMTANQKDNLVPRKMGLQGLTKAINSYFESKQQFSEAQRSELSPRAQA